MSMLSYAGLRSSEDSAVQIVTSVDVWLTTSRNTIRSEFILAQWTEIQ